MDEVEKHQGNCSLITLGLSEKFYSTGFDLKVMPNLHPQDRNNFRQEYYKLNGRIHAFHIPTIAMLNGYVIAGGAVFALAHDYRIMRNDFGYLHMNEIEYGLPIQ